jgi:hypothetical protein
MPVKTGAPYGAPTFSRHYDWRALARRVATLITSGETAQFQRGTRLTHFDLEPREHW